MYHLYNDKTGELIGTLSQAQLEYLQSRMEEESLEDKDYSITPMEIAYFESDSADSELLKMLREAIGDKNEVIIRWSKPE